MNVDISNISPDPSSDDRFKWFHSPVSKLVETIKANTEYLTKTPYGDIDYCFILYEKLLLENMLVSAANLMPMMTEKDILRLIEIDCGAKWDSYNDLQSAAMTTAPAQYAAGVWY